MLLTCFCRFFFLMLFLLGTLPGRAQAWEPYNELGDLYPSLAIAMMHMGNEPDEADPTSLGDPNGVMGIHVKATRANTVVRLEMTCSTGLKLFDRATLEATLPKAGEVYTLSPVVPFNQALLASVRQTQSIFVTYRVSIDGKKQPDRTERLLVHPINECPFGFTDEADQYESIDWMFAAYVNENHPQIERILQTALKKARLTPTVF